MMAYELELNGHDPEIDYLNCWPDEVVRLQGRNIHITQFVGNSSATTTFSKRHRGEEESNSWVLLATDRRSFYVMLDTYHMVRR